MAKIKNGTLTISCLLVIFTGLTSSVVLKGQVSQKPNAAASKTPVSDDVKRDFPTVDYFDGRAVDSERQKRNAKYDKYPVLDINTAKDTVSTSFMDWADELPVLPVKESEIVAIGKVSDVQGYLSNNKASVYTEITLEIEKQFKNTSAIPVSENKTLKAERDGGIVRYPSSYETFYFVSGQRLPKISKRYLLFLSSKFPLYGLKKDDLYLITAYELSDGKVIPLDNPGGGTHKIATFYRDKSETVLLNDLRGALKSSDN